MRRSMLIARWSSWTPGGWLCSLLVSLIIGNASIRTAYPVDPVAVNFPGKITLQDGKLTAQLTSTPLWQVMEEVSKLSGAEVFWLNPGGEEPVSADFTALPFSEALQRILGKNNFLLFYTSTGEEGRLTQIWISSRGIGKGHPMRALPPGQAMMTPPLPAVDPASQGGETVAPGREALDSMPLDTVIQTAMNDDDLSVRLEAIARLKQDAQEDPRVKATLSHIARNDSDPQVRDAASNALAEME
ncbi:MAG TPA: HEAT repeat domain-containing protein [Candidatus Binatia bacterium]|nr:HEAT repeat domain-containing protein [Candidatus Binatia bacterium]